MKRISVIDSHTGGEPTRVIVDGGPDLGDGPMSHRLERLRGGFDRYRTVLVNEPRGSDVMVGAILLPPQDPANLAGVIFFNNVGYLGMCGHGTIGVVETLKHMGRISPGTFSLETPVGDVAVELSADGKVSFENVPSYRYRTKVPVHVAATGRTYVGDIAYGGNWFFITDYSSEPLDFIHMPDLLIETRSLMEALADQGITSLRGHPIDHVELCWPLGDSVNGGRNFVLCPGGEFDRSPCGTGTSAKLACLAADGKLKPGEIWRQESIIGSVFEASYRRLDTENIVPRISGRAYITGEATLLVDRDDPLAWGFAT